MLAASSAIPVIAGSTVPGWSGRIPALPGALPLLLLLQGLGCRFVVDMLETPGPESDGHDVMHLPVGVQDVEVLVSQMLE